MESEPNNAKMPAFPVKAEYRPGQWNHEEFFGLTKREYAAIEIFAALIAGNEANPNGSEVRAKYAVKKADELLKQLEV